VTQLECSHITWLEVCRIYIRDSTPSFYAIKLWWSSWYSSLRSTVANWN